MTRVCRLGERLMVMFFVIGAYLYVSRVLDKQSEVFEVYDQLTSAYHKTRYLTFFMVSVPVFIMGLFYHLRLSKIETVCRFNDSRLRFTIMFLGLFLYHVMYLENYMQDDFYLQSSLYMTIGVMIMSGHVWNAVYVTDYFLITGNMKFDYDKIEKISFKDTLKISVQAGGKHHYIFCFTNKRYDFIKEVLVKKCQSAVSDQV